MKKLLLAALLTAAMPTLANAWVVYVINASGS